MNPLLKLSKPYPLLHAAVKTHIAQGKTDFWIEGFIKGWVRAVQQDARKREVKK
jgi:hypothetical protein